MQSHQPIKKLDTSASSSTVDFTQEPPLAERKLTAEITASSSDGPHLSTTTSVSAIASFESKDIPYFSEYFSNVDEIKENIQKIIQLCLERKPANIGHFDKMFDNYFLKLLNKMDSSQTRDSVSKLEKFLLTRKQTLPSVVNFLNDIHYKLYFFGGYACAHSNNPNIPDAHAYYRSMQAFVKKLNYQEPNHCCLAILKTMIDCAESYDDFHKENKSLFAAKLAGIPIFKNVRKYMLQCKFIHFALLTVPFELRHESFPPFLKELDSIFEKLQAMLPAAETNGLKGLIDPSLNDLNNTRLYLNTIDCHSALNTSRTIPLPKTKLLEYIDKIKTIQPLVSNSFLLFDSHMLQSDIYQILSEDTDDLLYDNLSKQCYTEASRYINAPEISYLVNLLFSLHELKKSKTKLSDDTLLARLSSSPFPEKTLLQPLLTNDLFNFLHGKIESIIISALTIATNATDRNNPLFAYHFLDFIVKQVLRFFTYFPLTPAFFSLFQYEKKIPVLLNLKATLASALTLTPDLSEELTLLQTYVPSAADNFVKKVKTLGLSLSCKTPQTSSPLEHKQSEKKQNISEVKTNNTVTLLSLSEINAAAHEICKSKTDTSAELTIDSPVYKLTHHFLERLTKEQYTEADDEAKEVIQFIDTFHPAAKENHAPVTRLYSQANKIQAWSKIFSMNLDDLFEPIRKLASAPKLAHDLDPFFDIPFMLKSINELKQTLNEFKGKEKCLIFVDKTIIYLPLALVKGFFKIRKHLFTLNPDYLFIKNSISELITELERMKNTIVEHAPKERIDEINQQLIMYRLFYHHFLIKMFSAYPAHENETIGQINLNIDITSTLIEQLPKTYPSNAEAIRIQLQSDLSSVMLLTHGTDFPDNLIISIMKFATKSDTSNKNIMPFAALNMLQITLLNTIHKSDLSIVKEYLKSFFSNLNKQRPAQTQGDPAESFIFQLTVEKFALIQHVLFEKILSPSLMTQDTQFVYDLMAHLINSTIIFIKSLCAIAPHALDNRDQLFKNLLFALEQRIMAGKTLNKPTQIEEDLLKKLRKPNFLFLEYFADDLNVSFELNKELKDVEPAKKSTMPSDLIETLQLDQTEVDIKDSSDNKATKKSPAPAQPKITAEDIAKAKKKEAEEKISQAIESMESNNFNSAISSLKYAQDILSSKTCRDNDTRLLKIKSAILLSDCHTENMDYKSSAIRVLEAQANLKGISGFDAPALDALNDLLFSLHGYYQKLVSNQISDLKPHSFIEKTFTDSEKITDLISLTKRTITKAINKGMALNKPKSVSSIMPTTAVLDTSEISPHNDEKADNNATNSQRVISQQEKQKPNSLSTSSSSSAAVKTAPKKPAALLSSSQTHSSPKPKINANKQDAKLVNQHQASYATKTKSKEQKQKSQSSSSSTTTMVNQSFQKNAIVSFPGSLPKPKEDKKQEVTESSSQKNKSGLQSSNQLRVFSIPNEKPEALSSSAKVNEEKNEIKGYQPPKDLTIFSEAMEEYLKRYENELTIRQQIEKLNLDEGELEIFKKDLEKFYDLVEIDHIRMPVLINGHSFDLESMLGLPYEVEADKPGKPIKRSRLSNLPQRKINGSLFTMETLQPDWNLHREIKLFVKEVEAYRIANKPASESATIQSTSTSTLSK